MPDASRVHDLRPGDHVCLTFSDGEERLDLVAAFVRDGLNAGQKVLCVTDTLSGAALSTELAGRGLDVDDAAATGQMSVLGSDETFLAGGSFASSRMIDLLRDQIGQASREGFAGLWVTSDMCWALRPVIGLEELWVYESQMNQLLADNQATSVCQYDRQCFDTVTLAGAAATHAKGLAAITYHNDPLLRICRQYQPSGVRVSGEIDYRQIEPLTLALSEAIGLDDHITVNLASLAFTDGSAAGVLMQTAAALRDDQRMTVHCRPQAGKLLTTLGLDELPGVTVVVLNDE